MCHGVLDVPPREPRPAVADLARRVAPGRPRLVVARNGDAMAWRPAVPTRLAGSAGLLDEHARAAAEGRDARYRNEIGVHARADTLASPRRPTSRRGTRGRPRGTASGSPATTSPSTSPRPTGDELAGPARRRGAARPTDPYRALGTLVHVIAAPDGPDRTRPAPSPLPSGLTPGRACLARTMDAVDRVERAFAAVPRAGFLPPGARAPRRRRRAHPHRARTDELPATHRRRHAAPARRATRPARPRRRLRLRLDDRPARPPHRTRGRVVGVELEPALARWGAANLAAAHGCRGPGSTRRPPGCSAPPTTAPRTASSCRPKPALPQALVDQLGDPDGMVIPVAGTHDTRRARARRAGDERATGLPLRAAAHGPGTLTSGRVVCRAAARCGRDAGAMRARCGPGASSA